MKRMFAFAAVSFALVLATGCSGEDGEGTEHEHEHDDIDTTGTDSILALTGDVTNGGTLYESTCTPCHASDGSGGIGPSLIEAVDELSDAQLAGAVRNGIDDEMPAQTDFTDQDIADVVAYIKATF